LGEGEAELGGGSAVVAEGGDGGGGGERLGGVLDGSEGFDIPS
jgi:hypothetical protein